MKFLISEDEILKHLHGSPTGYISTGTDNVTCALNNGDFIKFYYNYLKPEKYAYGQIRYDSIFEKDYYIDFNDFTRANNEEKYAKVYLKDLIIDKGRRDVTNTNIDKCLRFPIERVITNITIDKCLKFPSEHAQLFKNYVGNKDEYNECLKLLSESKEKFYKRIIELYERGNISFLPNEIEKSVFDITDPNLKIKINYEGTGEEIEELWKYSLKGILISIECFIKKNCFFIPYSSLNGAITPFGYESSSIYVYINYNTIPKHELTIFISKHKKNKTTNTSKK